MNTPIKVKNKTSIFKVTVVLESRRLTLYFSRRSANTDRKRNDIARDSLKEPQTVFTGEGYIILATLSTYGLCSCNLPLRKTIFEKNGVTPVLYERSAQEMSSVMVFPHEK